MSVSPRQNFSNPPPVPDVATVTLMFGDSVLNFSAAAEVSGATVDEPSTRTLPLAPSVDVLELPHAASASDPTASADVITIDRVRFTLFLQESRLHVQHGR